MGSAPLCEVVRIVLYKVERSMMEFEGYLAQVESVRLGSLPDGLIEHTLEVPLRQRRAL